MAGGRLRARRPRAPAAGNPIKIDGVSSGYADVAIAMGGGEKQQRVWVDAGRSTVLPLGSSGGSAWDSVKGMAMSLMGVVLYTLIRERF